MPDTDKRSRRTRRALRARDRRQPTTAYLKSVEGGYARASVDRRSRSAPRTCGSSTSRRSTSRADVVRVRPRGRERHPAVDPGVVAQGRGTAQRSDHARELRPQIDLPARVLRRADRPRRRSRRSTARPRSRVPQGQDPAAGRDDQAGRRQVPKLDAIRERLGSRSCGCARASASNSTASTTSKYANKIESFTIKQG